MKSKSKLKRVAPDRWPGVYSRELQTRHQGKPDISYYITYKDHAARKRWEKAGKRSEGYTPQIASEIRTERLRTARHGGEVKTAREIQVEKYKKDRTLQTIADAYFDSEHGMKLKGRKTDKNRWELHLKPLIGKRRVSSLTVLDVQHLKKSMEKKAPATIWNTLELLRRICNYGRKINYCPPLSFTIEMPKRKNAREEFLSPEEAQRLIGVLEAWKRQDVARMLKLAMFTGMRRGEIFKLQDDDIDWLHERIILQAPKGGRTVSIPLSGIAAEIIRNQMKWRDRVYHGSPYVFPGKNGGKRVYCSGVTRIKERAGLPEKFRIFHGLRNHYAVKLANSGQFDLSMIQELLTHNSPEMTKRYGQYLPETIRIFRSSCNTFVRLINLRLSSYL